MTLQNIERSGNSMNELMLVPSIFFYDTGRAGPSLEDI